MTRFDLVEYGTLSGLALTTETAVAMGDSKALTVTPTSDGLWQIKASSFIGVVQTDDTEVHIEPKVPVQRVLFLIAYSLRGEGWKQLSTMLSTSDDLIEGAAAAFIHHAESALAQGVLQGYVTVNDSLPGLRGRLREADQLRRRFGLAVPLEVTFDDFTVDIAENRMLKSAVHRLLLLRNVSDQLRRRLRRISHKLEGVSVLVPGQPVPFVRQDRRNARYADALSLAELILRSVSIETGESSSPAVAFLFDMNRVFEDFATRAFQAHGGPGGARFIGQRSVYLDVEGTIQLRPDLTWIAEGEPRAVVDLKYKSIEYKDVPNADVYQALAYSVALELDSAHLVYAAGNDLPSTRTIQSVGTGIKTWTLDLNLDPEALLASVAALAERIANGQVERLGALRESDLSTV